MSSLRVDSLRLCWLEAFIALVDGENISGVARELGLNQSTVSRYMQALETWLGKKLTVPLAIEDPSDARKSVGITADGQAFYGVAMEALQALTQCRDEAAIRAEIIADMDEITCSMEKDRKRKIPLPVTEEAGGLIDYSRRYLTATRDVPVPLEILKGFQRELRASFNRYEVQRNKDKRRSKRKLTPKMSGADIQI